MAHVLQRAEPVDAGIRRVAAEWLAQSLERVRARDEEVVHDVRRECKQVRALLRLVRRELGEEAYRRESDRLRSLARPLAGVRDAQALVAALDSLVERFSRELKPGAFSGLRRVLRRELHQRQETSGRALRHAEAELRRALRAVPRWPIGHRGWKALAPGLRRTYARGRRALSAAQASGSDADLHAWRKQVKYLRAELEVVEKMWPDALAGLTHALHQLSDLLGDDHDLAVLAASLANGHAGALAEDARAALQGLIFRRRGELQRAAFRLGRRLYADPPGLFVRSLHEHWRAWHRD